MTSVLHVETRHRTGGAERNVNHFAAWQHEHGLRVGLAYGPDSLASEVPAGVEGIAVPRLVRCPDPIRDALVVRDLRRVLVDGGWDVVHTHQSKAGIVGRVAARGRVRLVIHTVHMVSFGPGYSALSSAVFRRAERRTSGWTDVLIAVGEELRERYLAAGVGRPDRFRVIRSPIDIDRFAAVRSWPDDRRQEVRDELGLGNTGPVILVVAALEPRKRVDLVLERLADRLRSGWSLVIAGDGSGRNGLQAASERMGVGSAVRLLGSRSDIDRLMGAADVLVHAAEAEGVPQVVIQALAAGLPVVATDVVGLREVEGAGIVIADVDGSDLAGTASAAIESPPLPVDLQTLKPWHPDMVTDQIARLHADVGLTS